LLRAHSRGAKHKAVSAAAGPTWFDDEAPLRTTGRITTRRLIHRAVRSWRVWLVVVLVASAAYSWRRATSPGRYEATVVMRVSEGAVASTGLQLAIGALRAYVNDMAFTTSHLSGVMSKHKASFPMLAVDEASAIDAFRQRMGVAISQNDFIEDRVPGDPPRSARLAVSFEASDPELAWAVAHELADLIVGAAMGGERDALRREREAAALEVAKDDVDLQTIVHQGAPPLSARVEGARGRLAGAQQREAAAELALHALDEQQVLRFEVIDPGRAPQRHDPVSTGVSSFVWTTLALSAAALLFAGAYDPRILDGADLPPLGVAVLGQLPALPLPPGSRRREQPLGSPRPGGPVQKGTGGSGS
jgi:hypothetical protein